MNSKTHVLHLLNTYSKQYVKENINECRLFVQDNDMLYARQNFKGHITASAIIVEKDWRRVFLLLHKLYNRFLCPGGHIESLDNSISEAALREAIEETGIPAHHLELYKSNEGVPLDIDSHAIPANYKKNEPAHVHHDFRYVYVYTGDYSFEVPPAEAKEARWVPLDELAQVEDHAAIAAKLAACLHT